MRYEVFYTYTVDASIRVEAASEQEAMDKVEKMWSEAAPKTLDTGF
jgi:hypothetical protein